MDDPVLNCVLAVCCPPLRAEAALARQMERYGIEPVAAAQCAEFVLKTFDLAEKGTLAPLKDSIARLARGVDYKE